jgi:hypothetical protein
MVSGSMGSLRKNNGPLKVPRLRMKDELIQVREHEDRRCAHPCVAKCNILVINVRPAILWALAIHFVLVGSSEGTQ